MKNLQGIFFIFRRVTSGSHNYEYTIHKGGGHEHG